MWRIAQPSDDDSLVEMCLDLYREDPGPLPITPEHIRRTLAELRRAPSRGRAVVLEVETRPAGYALLISFWSNELGGEVCEVDELFVVPHHRKQGFGTALFTAIADGSVWPTPAVAIALGVTPANVRARQLYERLGFSAIGISLVRRTPRT
jgi:GNAT superfamily N-acetyltransferase